MAIRSIASTAQAIAAIEALVALADQAFEQTDNHPEGAKALLGCIVNMRSLAQRSLRLLGGEAYDSSDRKSIRAARIEGN